MGISESTYSKEQTARYHYFRKKFPKNYHFYKESSDPVFGLINFYQSNDFKDEFCFIKFLKS